MSYVFEVRWETVDWKAKRLMLLMLYGGGTAVSNPLVKSKWGWQTTINNAQQFINQDASFRIHNDNESLVDLTPHQNSQLQLSFAIKLSSACDQTELELLMVDSTWVNCAQTTFPIVGGDKWQQVVIPYSRMQVNTGFSPDKFKSVRFLSKLGETSVANGDTITIADLKITYVKENGDPGDGSDGVKTTSGVMSIWKNSGTNRLPEPSSGLSSRFVAVSDPRVESSMAMETTFTDATSFINRQNCAYYIFNDGATTTDLNPYLYQGLKLSFAIKLPAGRDNIQFRVLMGDKNWTGFADTVITVTKGGEWQDADIPFSSMNVSNTFDKSAFSFVWIQPVDGNTLLQNGDTCTLADLEVTYDTGSSSQFIIDIPNYHPGAPGYDVVYDVVGSYLNISAGLGSSANIRIYLQVTFW